MGHKDKDKVEHFLLLPSQLALPSSVIESYLEFVRQRHKEENRRPGGQDTRVSIYLGTIAIIVTGMSIFYGDLPMGNSILHWILYSALAISLVLLIYLIINLWRYFWGHKYTYPPTGKEMLEAALFLQTSIEAAFEKKLAHLADKPTMTLRAFNLYLADTFTKCSASDRQINDEKSRILVIVGRAIIGSIFLISIALVINFLIK